MDNEKFETEEIEDCGITESEAIEIKNVLKRFMQSYADKDSETSEKTWLAKQFKTELPHLSDAEAENMSNEVLESISEFDDNLASLDEACAKGINKEDWFSNKISEAASGMSVVDYGNYLNNIDTAISNANAQMVRTLNTKSGEISLCRNLDGFLAEQHHVNSFNMQAALEKSDFRAEVQVPGPHQTYGRNSFDLVIKNIKTGKIVHQYQCKFGADAESTIKLIKDGNYNNQRYLVPEGQAKAVRKAFSGKSVEEYIGGTDAVKVQSKVLTKEQAKALQTDAQQKNTIVSENWNSYSTRALAKHIGANAAITGAYAGAVTFGLTLAGKAFKGEKVEFGDLIKTAWDSGKDSGIKSVAAGTIKVCSEKGLIRLIPKGTPIGAIVNIACLGIENIKILWKVAKGELTLTQALDRMGRTTMSMIYGLSCGAKGALVGAALLSWIPIVGPAVGGLIGGMVGYMAGSEVGNAIYSAHKKIASVAKSVAVSAYNGIKRVVNNSLNSAREFVDGILS